MTLAISDLSVVRALNQSIPAAGLNGAGHRRSNRAIATGADAQVSGDGLVLAILSFLSDSNGRREALQESLRMLTVALAGRIGELWLCDAKSRLELEFSSSDGSAEVVAFEAAGKEIGAEALPFVGRVAMTGRALTVAKIDAATIGARTGEARSADIHSAMAFPLRTDNGVVGVLAIFRQSADRPARELVETIPTVCRHLARFLERARADVANHEASMHLAEQASTDVLTGLNNRREFDRVLRTLPRQPFAMMSLDVDGLKHINDTNGHAAGDALLRSVGHTLGLLVRGWDVMARVGGDEFAALLPEIGVTGAAIVSERIRLAMHALVLPSGPVRVTVGWSAAPAGADPVSVWQRADESLYQAKHAGGDQVIGSAYGRGEAGDIADKSYSDLVLKVLEGEPLSTVFQPIVDLFDGSVIGYEALARPEGFAAIDSVEDLFESARTSGHIRDLDWVCRRKALSDARALPLGVALFLNISAAALIDHLHGVDQLLPLLETVGRAPDTVVLEITEHERIRDYESLAKILATYRAEGIRFAVDDVGEGHSTFELLAASASEYLKLGRSLTMTSSRVGSRATIDAALSFARSSGATVVAESVENEFIADLMKKAGIRHGQGFGLGKPTAAEDIEDVSAALTDRAALSGLRPRSGYLFDS